MGDLMSLIEKAEQQFDETDALALERKLRRNDFGLDDFLDQLKMIRKMGPLSSLLGMIPGFGGQQLKNMKVDERELDRIQAIILSMTPEERRQRTMRNGKENRPHCLAACPSRFGGGKGGGRGPRVRRFEGVVYGDRRAPLCPWRLHVHRLRSEEHTSEL